MNKKHLPFWILTAALFIGLIVPNLIQDGMFMDGQLYTNVSKNLGNGIGTFWNPISSETWNVGGKASFHEHPPLVFGIQSLFFKVLGNSMYVERFYVFLTAILTAYLIFLNWKILFKHDKKIHEFSWLPILLWIIVPVAHWSFQNNMQENTMGLFALSAVYFSIRGIKSQNRKLLYFLLSGTAVFLASFSKGVPGFFPIVVIGLYWLVYRIPSFNKTVAYTVILIAIPVLIYALMLMNNEAFEALSFYVNKRLLGRIETAPTVVSRFHTVFGLISHLLPVLIISAILFFVFVRKSIKSIFKYKKESILFILIGLSGSLPLMLTMVQKDFYFSHTIPYFAIGFAAILLPGLSVLFDRIKLDRKGIKVFKIVSVTLLVISLGLSIYSVGGASRNGDELNDCYLIGGVVPENTIVEIDNSISLQYGFRFYLVRYFNISSAANKEYDYFIVEKSRDKKARDKYDLITLDTKKYNLYKKRNKE